MAALAATAAANGPAAAVEKRAEKMYTLELGPGETVEVTEDEKFQMIDVREPKT
jgi:leucyl aminopeptidase